MRPTLALFCLLTPLALTAHADWPQWRGPNRDGVAVGAKLPARWPEKLPAPKWSAPVGIGYSSPAIAAGRVFLMGREESNETCLAFDAATGKPLWKHTYASAYQPPDPTAGKGPNSTPTVDRDRVYMLGLGGMFHCLEAKSGKILWKHDLAKEYWGVAKDELGEDAWRPPCGASASALVEGNTVILPVGGSKAGSFAAFDRSSGKLLWKAPLDDRSSYASPLITELAGQRQLVGFTGKRMVGLNASDRRLLWEHPFKAMYEQTIITPVIWNNRVIVCGEAQPTTALELTSDGSMVAQKSVWKNADLSAYLVTPVVVKDHLIGFDQRGKRLVCVNLADGKTAWTSPRTGKIFASLVVVGEHVLALSDSGDLTVLAADPKAYTPIATYKVAAPNVIWSQLAVSGSHVYVRDQEKLTCYDFGADA